MKVEIQAGAKLDIVTPAELDEKLGKLSASWMTELARGVKFHDISGQTVLAGGAWTIGATGAAIGPAAGFVWAVTRLAVTGNGIVPANDTWSVFKGDAAPSKVVRTGVLRQVQFQDRELILTESDSLIVSGVGTGAVAPFDVNLAGAVVELPVQLAWQLL